MIVSFNTKISRSFLCDELVQPDALTPLLVRTRITHPTALARLGLA